MLEQRRYDAGLRVATSGGPELAIEASAVWEIMCG